jgi:hypothetical protein
MQFHIKWQGDQTPTWEPYKNLRDNAVVHLYCWQHKALRKLIPARYLSEDKKRLLSQQELQVQVEEQQREKRRRWVI